MKAMRKLIPAVCMLLVAAALLGTSTYAWFSMNTVATAYGMTVQAISSGGLAIASYSAEDSTPGESDFVSKAEAKQRKSDTALVPVSTADFTNWFTAKAQNVDGFEAYAETEDDALYTAVETTNGNGYYLLSKFRIKSMNTKTSGDELYLQGISFKRADGSAVTEKTLNSALRVAISYGGENFVFAPFYTTTISDDLYHVDVDGTERVAYDDTTPILYGGKAVDVDLGTLTNSSTGSDLFVYVYYEGEDDHCRSINAVNIDELVFTLTFTSKPLEEAAPDDGPAAE